MNILSSHEIELNYLKSLDIGHEIKSLCNKLEKIETNENVILPPPDIFSDEEFINKTNEDDGIANERYQNDSDWETIEDETENSYADDKLPYNEATLKFINKKPIRQLKKSRRAKPTVVSCPPEPKEIRINDANDDGFHKVESKSQRRRRLQENSLLQGAPPPMRNIFVSRVKYGNVLTIKSFLNKNNIYYNNVDLVSHDNSKFNSFKIDINKFDVHKVMQSNFWPIGVKCNIWREKSKNNVQYYNSRFIDNHLLS